MPKSKALYPAQFRQQMVELVHAGRKPRDLATLKDRGARKMVYHNTSAPIFSSDDTTAWYESLRAVNQGDPFFFSRFFRVPGMTQCPDGPTTDQFDMLTPLVNWIEKGQAPEVVIASARGVGNAGGVNASLPSNWLPARTRPLCMYPNVARNKGTGSADLA